MPGDPHRAAHGDQDGRGLFRRRRARAACEDGGRERSARAAARVRILPQGRADHRRVQGDRRRGGAPGLRLPVRARELRQSACQSRHHLHRPAAQGDRGDGRQDRIQEAGAESGREHRPRLSRRHRDHRRSAEDRQGHRLPGDDEGLGRRRRQGHAPRLERAGRARGLRQREARGARQLRRRPRVHREIHRGAAPHRDPAARRPARQHPLSERARMLDPAPQPEGGRGSAVAVRLARDAQGDGRAGGRAGAGGRILFAPARSS